MIIFWYCPERVTPAAPYEQIVEDFHLYPDEPPQLTELEQKIYFDSFTEEEKELLLTDIDEDDPDYPGFFSGLDLKREEVEFFRRYLYSKDQVRRCVNELFTLEEINMLERYLMQKYGIKIEKIEVECPISKIELQSLSRDPWYCEYEPDYILHEDPDFPLDIPVEGLIEPVYELKTYVVDGRTYFQEYEDEDEDENDDDDEDNRT